MYSGEVNAEQGSFIAKLELSNLHNVSLRVKLEASQRRVAIDRSWPKLVICVHPPDGRNQF
jgi:hypothetical protein